MFGLCALQQLKLRVHVFLYIMCSNQLKRHAKSKYDEVFKTTKDKLTFTRCSVNNSVKQLHEVRLSNTT